MIKLQVKDITPKMIEDAQNIVRHVVKMQTMPNNLVIGLLVLNEIVKLTDRYKDGILNKKVAGLNVGLHDGLNDGLRAGLNDGLHVGLNAGLRAGLRAGLDAGLNAGLHDGLHDGLRAGLDDGLHVGLHDGLRAGLHAGLNAGLDDGLHDGLRAGLNDGLHVGLHAGLRVGLGAGLHDGLGAGLDAGLDAGLVDGLRAGLHAGLRVGLDAGLDAGLDDGLGAGLDAGLDDGLRDGLHDGLNDGLHAGLRVGLDDGLHALKIQYLYCGVFWSWWLARYLIVASWGVELDKRKLSLLYMFCRHSPLIGKFTKKDGSIIPVVLPKPSKILWREVGLTTGEVPLPIFELHSDGESTVRSVFGDTYYHHNVKIPERMGKVPPSKWKPEWVADEQNAEVRMILIREIGVKKFLDQAAEVDSWRNHLKNINLEWFRKSDYRLFDLKEVFGVEESVLALHMINQTTGDIHVEFVSDDCKTILDALTMRDGLPYNDPEVEVIIDSIH